MAETPITQLIGILSASIAPVIVISGVGLLLLSMTNRHSRVIDRARELTKDLEGLEEGKRHCSILHKTVVKIASTAAFLSASIFAWCEN